jgi:hypothetical protein
VFSPAEVTTWSVPDVLSRIADALPDGWTLGQDFDGINYQAGVLDAQGVVLWSDEHRDPKLLFLNCLGWLHTRTHKTRHPAWKARDAEVPLYRPSISSKDPDPPDLDPDEIAAVYKTTR